MASDGESFGWVSTDSENESVTSSPKSNNLSKMVKLEKHSSDDDAYKTSAAPQINKSASPTNNVIRKQEKITPVKVERSNVNRKSKTNGLNVSRVLESAPSPAVRSNGSVSDNTRRNKELLDYYIQNNENLTKNAKLLSYDLTDDDEIFLLQCPPNIDLDSLLGLEFLDKDKKKFKMGIKSYECVLSNKNDIKLSLLIPPKSTADDYRLHTFNVQGSYVIKEKIKSNNELEVLEEAVSVVPFPSNLKQRHPLFGASYKSLIKIPQTVKEKFTSPVCKLPKLKKVKVEPVEEEEIVVEPVVVTKKSKKRKAECIEDEDNSYEPKKKIKKENHMLWMTEKSIEKSLFDIPVKSKKKDRQSL